MPYIPAGDRPLAAVAPDTPGRLNYAITKLIVDYLGRKGLSYSTINEAVGALECAKQEFYARVARPYEDRKITESGDVYDLIA